jgi:molybdate transport system substrate-binding protein
MTATDETLRILSADAPKTGLRQLSHSFSLATGVDHDIELLTGPKIKARILAGEANADLVVIPREQLEDLVAAGHVGPEEIAMLGHVTVGVAVRNGAREPDLASVDSFVRSVLAADRVIYNTASSGLYVASVFERLGLIDAIKEKSTILPTGKATMETLAADESGGAICFGHATEIRLHDALGTHYAGPLPGDIGRRTPYAAGPLLRMPRLDVARRFIAYLTSAEGKKVFAETGVT